MRPAHVFLALWAVLLPVFWIGGAGVATPVVAGLQAGLLTLAWGALRGLHSRWAS